MKTAPAESVPPSRLSDFCRGLMEACWLAAIVLVPLLYNPHGVAGFQPFKMAFIRVVALVLAGAWVVLTIEDARSKRPNAAKQKSPRLILALWTGVGLLALMQVVASILSVDPAQSLWGFSANRWGIPSFFAELVIFAGVASHLRSPAQMDRLTGAMILPTIPICFFAIAEAFGFSPQSVDLELASHGWRSVSFAGHQISLGAHLGMVIPFTLTRIFEIASAPAGRRRLFPAVVYGAILLLQGTGLCLAKSRGPLLATIAVCTALVVAWAAIRKSKALLLWGAAAAFCAVAFLGILSIPGGPLSRLARMPVLDKFSSAVPVGGNAADGFRTSLWSRAPGVVLPDAPFVFPDSRQDLHPGIRSVIGYGPESLQGVLPRHWAFNSAVEKRLEKSFHNLFWDSWFSLGAIGVGAMLLLFATGVLLSFQALGFRPGKRDAAVGSLCGILICLAFVGRFGAGYLGLGVQAGLAAGMVSALASSIIFPRKKEVPPGPASRTSLPVIASGAALVGHLVETAFAFQVAATSLLFWVLLGMVAAYARQTAGELQEEEPHTPMRSFPWALPVLAALAMTAVMFAFVHLDFRNPMSWPEILSASLTRIAGTGAPSHLISLVLLPTLGMLGVFASAETARQGGRKWPAFLKTIAVAGVLAGSYAILKAGHIAAIGALPGSAIPVAEIVRQASRGESLPIFFFVTAGIILGLLAWACTSRGEPGVPRFARAGLIALPFAALAVVAAAYPTSLRFVLADTAYGTANLRLASPDLNTRRAGLDVLDRAIRYDPFTYEYRLRFSEASLAVASGLDVRSGNVILDRAVRLLTDGHAISQINPISYALARLHMIWAFSELLPELQKARALEARRHFTEALHFDPTADHISVESALVDGDLLGDRNSDASTMRRASSVFDPSVAREWAEAYAKWSVHEGHPLLKQRYAARGIVHFRTAIESADRLGAPKFLLLLGKGTLHRNLSQLTEALADFHAAVQEGHATDAWRAEAMLAHALSDLGDNPAALPHITRALETAPKEYHDALNQLRTQLQPR
jgi:hypothetical protein